MYMRIGGGLVETISLFINHFIHIDVLVPFTLIRADGQEALERRWTVGTGIADQLKIIQTDGER